MATQLFRIAGMKHDNSAENKVWVNGIQLECDLNRSPGGFTWDYHGGGPNALSAAILSKFIPLTEREEFDTLVTKFTDEKVRGWGYGDFMIHMDMEHWLRHHGGYKGPIVFQHHIADALKKGSKQAHTTPISAEAFPLLFLLKNYFFNT